MHWDHRALKGRAYRHAVSSSTRNGNHPFRIIWFLLLAAINLFYNASYAETQRVIVKFRSAISAHDNTASATSEKHRERQRFGADFTRITREKFATRHDYRRVLNAVAVDVDRGALERLRALPYVAAVYPDYQVHAVLSDSVPLIGADQAATRFGVTGAGVRVAVIDTGIDYLHPDLGGCLGPNCKVVGGYDFVNFDNDPIDGFRYEVNE